MRCPRCDQLWHHLDEPCPYCHLRGDSALLEELAHVRWIADEIARWPHIALEAQLALRQSYLDRRRELEIQLKLRLPRFTAEQAAQAWPELSKQEELHHHLTGWLRHQWLNPAATAELVTQTRQQALDLRGQLEGHARPAPTDAADLALTNFLLQVADGLGPEAFATKEAEQRIRASLLDQKQRLEVRLGLGPPLTLAPPAPVAAPERAPRTGASGRQPPPSPPEAPPLPWRDRLWRTLLSERTLQALLFLGIFLLFSAAISFVVWDWKDFSAPLRVTIPCAFTATFFGLGWFVRNRTHLLRSGIALSAIAALLIPIDFYSVYVNFKISSGDRPLFWFITSVMCLLAYILITLLIQNQLFGYLVGAAAGSVVLAGVELGHQAWSLSLDWRSASISLLALGLIFGTTPFRRRNNPPSVPAQPQRIFSEPLRALSLLTLGALMPLTFGWRYVDRTTYDTLHTAMTVTWWAGSLAFAWGAIQYRSRSLALLAAIALPVAVYMTQAALFNRAGVNLAWHAFGLAWLVPLYFVAGRAALARKDDPVLHSHGRVAVVSGVALLVVAAFWSLTDLRNGTAAACSHAVLTGAVVLAARLWRRPSYLYAASLFSFTAVTFAMTALDLTLAQMSLGWGSLAIAHILVALRVRGWLSRPIVVAGYVVAGLATLSPLVLYNGDLLLYTLGNWLGLTAWGARLAHQGQPGFSSGRASRRAVFHWLTALPLPFWIGLMFANRGPI